MPISRTCFIAIFLFISFTIFAQRRTGEEAIARKALLEDLDQLYSWITEAHGDPYRFSSREELRARFDEAKAQVNSKESMTGFEFFGTVLPIMAQLKDGHSRAFPPDLDRFYGKLILPLSICFYEGSPYVCKDYSGSELEGAEVLEINGEPASGLFKQMLPFIHRDGNVESSRYRMLENPLYLATIMKALGLSDTVYSIKVSQDGNISELKLTAMDQSTYMARVKELQSNKQLPGALSLRFENEVPILKVASFNPTYFKGQQQYFEQQLDALMKQVLDRNAQHLILDLRDNSGGEDTYNQYLLRYLIAQEFSLYGELTTQKDNYKFLPDGKHWDIDPRSFKANDRGTFDVTKYLWDDPETNGLGTVEPLENRYTGKLYVLVNGGTFSSAAECAAMLRHYQRATFIGQEAGGSYIGTVAGYTPTLRMKNSGVQINLSLISIKRTFFGKEWTDRGVMPDWLVEQVPGSKTDMVLDKALELIASDSGK